MWNKNSHLLVGLGGRALGLRAVRWLLPGKWLGELDKVSLADSRLVFSLLSSLTSNTQVWCLLSRSIFRWIIQEENQKFHHHRPRKSGDWQPETQNHLVRSSFAFDRVPSARPATHLSICLSAYSLIHSLTNKYLPFEIKCHSLYNDDTLVAEGHRWLDGRASHRCASFSFAKEHIYHLLPVPSPPQRKIINHELFLNF